eukprot:395531-Prorocentrum_minimum.AAC.5
MHSALCTGLLNIITEITEQVTLPYLGRSAIGIVCLGPRSSTPLIQPKDGMMSAGGLRKSRDCFVSRSQTERPNGQGSTGVSTVEASELLKWLHRLENS